MKSCAFSRLSFILILILMLQLWLPNSAASAAPLSALWNGVLFEEDFSDSSSGWTLGTEWQIGPAQYSTGQIFGNPDPGQDHTPTADNGVAGVVIGGNASTNDHGYYYLTSPVVNTLNAPGPLTLEYWRWLNSDYLPYMPNRIEVFNGSSWELIWRSTGATEDTSIRDSSWTLMTHDITAHKNANMRVRFGFATDNSLSGVYIVSSWNLDDVRIYVPNAAPVASDGLVTTSEDTPAIFTLSAVDADNGPLNYILLTSPAHGTLSGTAPDLTYIPEADYNGSDSFTFQVSDGADTSNTATLSLDVTAVNDAPSAAAAQLEGQEDTPLDITLLGADVEGSQLTYSIISSPTHGTLTGDGPSRIYTSDPDYNGEDSFSYLVNDGELDSKTATVTINVNAVNDSPAAEDINAAGTEDIPLDVTLVGSDIDDDPLSYVFVTLPTHGTLDGMAPNLTYTPDADYHGPDSFTYLVNDGQADSNTVTASITLAAVNDAPVASDDLLTGKEDTALALTLAAVDVDGDPLTYTILTSPAYGTLSGDAPNLIYTPDADYNGPDGFTFTVNDGKLDSTPAAIAIVITAENDVPTAQDISLHLDEDTSAAVTLLGSDPEAQPLTFTIVTPPAHGTLSGDAPDLTYTPEDDYNGPDTFTYLVVDESEHSTIATVTITIAPVNDAPTANAIPNQTWAARSENQFAITAFSDDDGDVLSYTASLAGGADLPAWLSLNGVTGVLSGSPANKHKGSYDLVVSVDDGSGGTVQATFTLTVTETPYQYFFAQIKHKP